MKVGPKLSQSRMWKISSEQHLFHPYSGCLHCCGRALLHKRVADLPKSCLGFAQHPRAALGSSDPCVQQQRGKQLSS
jgi:hypothetical protein